MAKSLPWKIAIIDKRMSGSYDVVFEKDVPSHRLTDRTAQALIGELYRKCFGTEYDDIVDAHLVRGKPQSFSTEHSRPHNIRPKPEKWVQGYSCGSGDVIVSATRSLTSEEVEFYKRERARGV